MHEERLFAQLRGALERAADGQSGRLVVVRVWIGALSHLTEERLREAWPALTQGGPAAGATLRVEVSSDLAHPDAGTVVLVSVDLADEEQLP